VTQKWWDMAGAKVDDPADYVEGYEYEIIRPEYGPFKKIERDNRGHSVELTIAKIEKTHMQIANCACGWRDLIYNYPEHVATFPVREVYR
jgi:hypothetical protein